MSPRRHDRRLPHSFSTAKKGRRERSPTILRVPATLRDKGRLSETLSDQVVFSLYGLGRVGDPRFQGGRRSEVQRNLQGRKGILKRKDTFLRVRRGGLGLQRATMYIYMYICMCVRMRLCPVKYEHARVKPAIDRGKRREKERRQAREWKDTEDLCNLTFWGGELQESALSTPESSYVPPIPTVSLDTPVSIYLSCTLFSHLASTRESATSLCNCLCRWKCSHGTWDCNIVWLKWFLRSHQWSLFNVYQ